MRPHHQGYVSRKIAAPDASVKTQSCHFHHTPTAIARTFCVPPMRLTSISDERFFSRFICEIREKNPQVIQAAMLASCGKNDP
jgi:hypothetical protein